MAAQINIQLIGVVATLVYTALITYLILKLTSVLTGGLRVTAEEESLGLDLSLHEEDGYKL